MSDGGGRGRQVEGVVGWRLLVGLGCGRIGRLWFSFNGVWLFE